MDSIELPKERTEEIILHLIELVGTLTMNPVILAVTNSIMDTISDKLAIEYLKDLNKGIDPITKLNIKKP